MRQRRRNGSAHQYPAVFKPIHRSAVRGLNPAALRRNRNKVSDVPLFSVVLQLSLEPSTAADTTNADATTVFDFWQAQDAAKKWVPTLGSTEVESLTTDQLIRWRNKVATAPKRVRTKRTPTEPATRATPDDDDARRARKATTNRIIAMLKAALNRAFYADRVSSDSAWRKIKPFKKVDEAVVRYLSIAEIRRLVSACSEDFRCLVEAALYTGCRYAELTRLRFEDYNDDSGTLSIRLSTSK